MVCLNVRKSSDVDVLIQKFNKSNMQAKFKNIAFQEKTLCCRALIKNINLAYLTVNLSFDIFW